MMELEERVIEAALSPGTKSVMLLGRTDAGKTTLASMLADLLSKEGLAGLLDLDMGQAKIGPPSTMAWGFVENGFKSWDTIKAQDFYFTGALSPPGNMLPALTGAALLMERALGKCARLVIDTTGLVDGPVARAYKLYKIDLLRPDLILVVQAQDELEHIISPYALMDKPRIIRLKTSKLARAKNMTERADFRIKRLKTFFEGSRVFEVDLNKCGVRRTKAFDDGPLERKLISFRDKSGSDICLGVIEKANLEKRTLLVSSPLEPNARYACIIIGVASAPFASFLPIAGAPP